MELSADASRRYMSYIRNMGLAIDNAQHPDRIKGVNLRSQKGLIRCQACDAVIIRDSLRRHKLVCVASIGAYPVPVVPSSQGEQERHIASIIDPLHEGEVKEMIKATPDLIFILYRLFLVKNKVSRLYI